MKVKIGLGLSVHPFEIMRRLWSQERVLTKFVLIPLARGDAELMDQTRRLVHEVLPRVHG